MASQIMAFYQVFGPLTPSLFLDSHHYQISPWKLSHLPGLLYPPLVSSISIWNTPSLPFLEDLSLVHNRPPMFLNIPLLLYVLVIFTFLLCLSSPCRSIPSYRGFFPTILLNVLPIEWLFLFSSSTWSAHELFFNIVDLPTLFWLLPSIYSRYSGNLSVTILCYTLILFVFLASVVCRIPFIPMVVSILTPKSVWPSSSDLWFPANSVSIWERITF